MKSSRDGLMKSNRSLRKKEEKQMKFFIPLGFRHDKDDDPYSNVGSIYGPYEDDKAVEDAFARLWPNNKEENFVVFDGQIVNIKPLIKEKPEEEKRAPGNMDNYVEDGGGYKCKDCGGTIIAARVAHPIRSRSMPLAGSGECQYEDVPYCPNCEKEPNFHGTPVYL